MSPKTPPVDFSTPFDPSILKSRSVFITGGASGIGRASATASASAGAFVTIGDISTSAGSSTVQTLASQGLTLNFAPCDVTDYESQFEAFRSAIAFGGGKIDIVVANAGIIAQKNVVEAVAEHEVSLDKMPPPPGMSGLNVNLKGNATPFKKALVLVASTAGYAGYPYSATYAMSKFGVRGLFYGTREAAMRQDPSIRVNLVAPWFIRTNMTTGKTSENFAFSVLEFAPIEYVSEAVVRVAGDERVVGRAVANMPEGNFDLGDNMWDGFGGVVMRKRVGGEVAKEKEKGSS
ncbi:NAD(P)-binding protein [Polyplosphaeria fusca]|uniref:NAD(P)-binding protein n=1 Tax=Polyplosphaeria fusca TaxID=682080 RepID=A0A9P4QM68_9PLEO|nr:NAD(P)-binding protein [Polyplosphaeria fusca]